MKAKIRNITGAQSSKEIVFPSQFSEEIRPDLIKRAVLTIQANKRQAYGAKPRAGMRHSAELSRRRRKYRGSYGLGISRVPRKILSRRGTRMMWVGATAPGTKGGRRAHPPKASKGWAQKINVKEKRKAIRSALSASINKELVENRGHRVPSEYPLVIESKAEELTKTKQVVDMLTKLGLGEELERCQEKKIRAGKGTMRGRKYKKKKGPLLVIAKKSNLLTSARSISGVDVEIVDCLNTELLAPGTSPGRLTIYTEDAIKRLNEEKLFTNAIIKKVEKVEVKK
ncbi:50S ribosomal protein L4 [Candidatus Woesearchaeota archaeon]|nr:50S ribosomal protein L4 [Candidatus Woesearchaeota archaeon]